MEPPVDTIRNPHSVVVGADEEIRQFFSRYAAAAIFNTQYWTPELHVGAFALPRFIADLVA